MPFKNLEKKRAYHRRYMRRRRRVLRERLNPVKFDPNRPHRTDWIKFDGQHHPVLVQDDRIYLRSTEMLLWIRIDGQWCRA